MSPSPAPAEIPATDPCWTLMDAFRSIPDPRHPRGIRHPLSSILALCIIALLSGRQNLTQIHRFAKDHPEVLEALGTRRRWVPVTTTLSTVLGLLRIGQLQDALAEWVCGLFRTVRSKAAGAVAAVDGKTSRASKVHVLNVFALDMQQAVWQCAVDEKANEITALRKILTALFEKYPFLKILTGDAMFAGNPLCSEIITHGRHYLFQIKGGQKHLYEKMDLVFTRHLSRPAAESCLTGEKKVTPSDVRCSWLIGTWWTRRWDCRGNGKRFARGPSSCRWRRVLRRSRRRCITTRQAFRRIGPARRG